MKTVKIFRLVAILEGISYLLLLGVTMPLKHFFDQPQFSFPTGMAHGVLFMAYIVLVFLVREDLKWSSKTTFVSLVASVIPFGTFYVDKKYLR